MMETTNKYIHPLFLGIFLLLLHSCSIPQAVTRQADKSLPDNYSDTLAAATASSSGMVNWKDFFEDPYLTGLIDSAMVNNKEVNILLQKISLAQNEIQARKGEYLPSVYAGLNADAEKVGRYTRNGAIEENLDIKEGKEFPKILGNIQLGLFASWELDVWKKLRNAQKQAALEYLASMEGRNFMISNLVAEIANAYYELIALDNQLDNLQNNIKIQQDALEMVNLLQQAGRSNTLAVKRFEAEVQKNKSNIYGLQQQIAAIENQLNFLVGRTPRPIERRSDNFLDLDPSAVSGGLPSELLQNRPDIRQMELELAAADLNIQVARAEFLPSFGLKAGLGYQAFNPVYLFTTPASIAFSLAGDAVAPLVNRNAIIAGYKNASAQQIQMAYEYEQTVLNAYTEVVTQLSFIDNLQRNYQLKVQQVDLLNESIEISNLLYQSARADYMEVLLTQRDALEARMELIETKKEQMSARINLYRALGGGWK
jgi:NodT family efflux transporter outer membrane factor (OMF) lipoprotein